MRGIGLMGVVHGQEYMWGRITGNNRIISRRRRGSEHQPIPGGSGGSARSPATRPYEMAMVLLIMLGFELAQSHGTLENFMSEVLFTVGHSLRSINLALCTWIHHDLYRCRNSILQA